MSEPRKPTKAELERIVSSKPRARKEVGYFTDAGEFRRGPYYSAMVGNQVVCFKHGTYREESGMYASGDHAD